MSLVSPMLFLLQSAIPTAPLLTLNEVEFSECLDLARTDAPSAITQANQWSQNKGGYLALACHGFALATDFQFELAFPLFAAAAKGAEEMADPRAARFWAQAGNAAIAAGQADVARDALNKALSSSALDNGERADILIDLARAQVALNQTGEAEKSLTLARELAPENGTAWLFSATLARRLDKIPDAFAYIQTSAALSPRDPAVALEAGNIAIAAGDETIARKQWQQAVAIAPTSRQATSAKAQLSALGPEAAPPGETQSR